MIHTPPGSKQNPAPEYLQSTRFLDSGQRAVRRFARQAAGAETRATSGARSSCSTRCATAFATIVFDAPRSPASTSRATCSRPNRRIASPKAILLAAAAPARWAFPVPSVFVRRGQPPDHGKTQGAHGRLTYFILPRLCGVVLGPMVKTAAPAFNIEAVQPFRRAADRSSTAARTRSSSL